MFRPWHILLGLRDTDKALLSMILAAKEKQDIVGIMRVINARHTQMLANLSNPCHNMVLISRASEAKKNDPIYISLDRWIASAIHCKLRKLHLWMLRGPGH